MIESCKQTGVDPVDYFAEVLGRVANQPLSAMDDIVPANWTPVPQSDPAPAVATVGV